MSDKPLSDFISEMQRLVKEITEAQDTNVRKMYEQQLAKLIQQHAEQR